MLHNALFLPRNLLLINLPHLLEGETYLHIDSFDLFRRIQINLHSVQFTVVLCLDVCKVVKDAEEMFLLRVEGKLFFEDRQGI